MNKAYFLKIFFTNSIKETVCQLQFNPLSNSIQIKWNDKMIEIMSPKRSMGKTRAGHPDPLVRFLYGAGNEEQNPGQFLLTVNCGLKIPNFKLVNITDEFEHFSIQIDHEEQIRIDEFIDSLPIEAQYLPKDYLHYTHDTILN